MISTGKNLSTFITSLNSEADIDATLLDVLVDNARTVLEEERPWMVLRRVNSSLSLAGGIQNHASVSMATITDFSRFYSDTPIRLYDDNNRVEYFTQVPFDRRLEYKDVSNTFCYDAYENKLYFNGNVAFTGTLYISYMSTTENGIDLTLEARVWPQFPPRFLPVLGFYAIGIFKGAIDYDSINRQMLPENRATFNALRESMIKWDDELQQSEMAHNDPTEYLGGGHHRDGAINRY